jgi:uncharacterized membrane protein YciS (DUF1049 family)
LLLVSVIVVFGVGYIISWIIMSAAGINMLDPLRANSRTLKTDKTKIVPEKDINKCS